MPIVNNSDKIVIEFSGEAADLLADVKAINRSFDEFSKQNKKIADDTQKMTQTGKTSWTEFRSALGLVQQGYQYLNQALDATSGKTVKYANDVRLLGQINGQTAESNSRLIQTLDDYKISVDDITTASKKMKDQGLSPTVDTIAKLAEQYQKIQDPAAKLKFAQDNLGKSTKDWLEVLNQSPEVLRKQAAGINENLILTQKQVDAARQLELAEDAKNDALQGVAITLGNKLVPIQKDFYNGINVTIRAIEIQTKTHVSSKVAIAQAADEIGREQAAMLQMRDAADQSSQSVDDLAASQKAAEETAKTLSSTYQGLLSSMFAIQSANDNYTKTVDDLAKKDEELANKKNQLTLQMWQEQQAGKLTNEENLKYIQQLAEVTKAQEENQKAKEKADEDVKKASQQRVYDLAQQKLAADGVISTGEYDYLQNLAVSYGLVSRASADQAIAENKRADALVSSFEQTLPPMERSLQVMQAIAAYNGVTVGFGVNFQSNVPSSYGGSSGNTYGTNGINYSSSFSSGQSNPMSVPMASHDYMGPGIAGTPYAIGTGAQPEVFVPKTDGMFYPKGKGLGDTYNITVNNPVPEKSADSIRRELRRRSIIGAGAKTQ